MRDTWISDRYGVAPQMVMRAECRRYNTYSWRPTSKHKHYYNILYMFRMARIALKVFIF